MLNSEIKYAMALTLIDGVGNINAKKLLAYCGNFTSVFSSNKVKLSKIPGIGTVLVQKIFNQLSEKKIMDRVEEEIEFIENNDVQVLYGKGNFNFNNSKIVSVVGTRKVTQRGKDICTKILEDLKPHNLLVISGMAYGVDIHAHKCCVQNEMATVGVLAHGLDRLYPSTHKPTADKMMKTGGLLTEFMSGTNPDRQNFPTRNRIIAGLADVTIVIESAKRGGSLITAEIANSYSRDVFSIPGRITDQYSEGCNYLIKINKAHLLNSAADIVYLMNWELVEGKPKPIQKKMFLELPAVQQLIYDSLDSENSIGMDELSMKTKLSTSLLSVGLMQLEFAGLVNALPGSSFRLS